MNYKIALRNIKLLVFDVDGVFTNNQILITESGEQLRSMNTRDGFALKMALNKGLEVAIITGGNSVGVQKRFEYLGLEKHIYLGAKDKLSLLKQIASDLNIQASEIAYLGDDIPDYEAMMFCGCKVCPVDAVPEILKIADYVSPIKGGEGVVRDLIEQTLKVQDKWFNFEGVKSV